MDYGELFSNFHSLCQSHVHSSQYIVHSTYLRSICGLLWYMSTYYIHYVYANVYSMYEYVPTHIGEEH